MHINYYFLCQLTSELKSNIVGSSLIDCYSQNKEELILTFSGQFHLKCHLQSQFSCISAPEQIHRSNRNSITLFSKILGKEVTGISQCLNDRSFIIHFTEGFKLLFKLYGNRSNIILFQGEEFQAMLKNKFERDKSIYLSELDRKIDQSYEAFINSDANLELLFPTFDKKIREFIELEGYNKSTIEQKWKIINRTLIELNSGKYYVTQWLDSITFSLLPLGNVISTENNALKAITKFFVERLKSDRFKSVKTQALRETLKEIRKLRSYIYKTEKALKGLSQDPGYRIKGDLLMANFHQILPHQEEISLPNFTDGKPITIKLKSRLSAQKNAEIFYRKAKNQNIQIAMMNSSLESKKKVLKKYLIKEEIINKAKTISELEVFAGQDPNSNVNKSKSLPFKKFHFMGYDILVGKNSKANDKLTSQYAKKNDMWLHAKGSSGSHVVIKQKPGNNFPKPVIEKAAELAAYYSKSKGESLCQVLYTERKYVRKRKDSIAGEVIVENEKVILVNPKIEL